MGKHSVSRLSFSRTCIFFLLTLSLLSSSLFYSSLLSDSAHLCFSSVHIVGSLTSKLHSTTDILRQIQGIGGRFFDMNIFTVFHQETSFLWISPPNFDPVGDSTPKKTMNASTLPYIYIKKMENIRT